MIDGQTIGRVRGSKLQTYTAGVVCAKVARYAERIHHPDRLMYPLRRTGPKGSGQFARISWDEALDEIADRFNAAEREFGAQSVWPYYYAGTMGLVMRDGINRLAHVKKYSRFYSTICANIARIGFAIGTGKIAGVDPREMGVSDLVVIWGTNPVNTQVNVMTHAMRARKERGARIAAVDIYNNDTMKQADIKIILRPGTDGAFACGVMHVLFREGLADRAYMDRYTDCPAELEAHLATRTPEWASSICGVPVAEIEAFARLVGADQTYVLPARLWFHPQPQWRGADARRAVHSGRDRRLAVRRRRRVLQQLRDLEVRRIHHRRPRRDRPQHAGARSVQDRAHPDRRRRGALWRRSGQGDADPEHQSDDGGAGADAGAPGICPRGPVHGGA